MFGKGAQEHINKSMFIFDNPQPTPPVGEATQNPHPRPEVVRDDPQLLIYVVTPPSLQRSDDESHHLPIPPRNPARLRPRYDPHGLLHPRKQATAAVGPNDERAEREEDQRILQAGRQKTDDFLDTLAAPSEFSVIDTAKTQMGEGEYDFHSVVTEELAVSQVRERNRLERPLEYRRLQQSAQTLDTIGDDEEVERTREKIKANYIEGAVKVQKAHQRRLEKIRQDTSLTAKKKEEDMKHAEMVLKIKLERLKEETGYDFVDDEELFRTTHMAMRNGSNIGTGTTTVESQPAAISAAPPPPPSPTLIQPWTLKWTGIRIGMGTTMLARFMLTIQDGPNEKSYSHRLHEGSNDQSPVAVGPSFKGPNYKAPARKQNRKTSHQNRAPKVDPRELYTTPGDIGTVWPTQSQIYGTSEPGPSAPPPGPRTTTVDRVFSGMEVENQYGGLSEISTMRAKPK
ncbi:uncharacterized protein BDR25DRAFT_376776 [Lindgomyces ingoldianus]|uniref:Uncharacterized protein n=1 Tax=Lindgomyces ingoldianus TaxID=673940 RepID=A0ACB6QJK8_9PLEO|nr:uncharacterized protein BDR25DRAFT_376776 [Lindgomyces ingoldianus]KAF2467116.1 hypothetical protein BDR25DRAFT_376776 [Lindgomyces ingoldianus]